MLKFLEVNKSNEDLHLECTSTWSHSHYSLKSPSTYIIILHTLNGLWTGTDSC